VVALKLGVDQIRGDAFDGSRNAVVALKREIETEERDAVHRSRNAVVALKLRPRAPRGGEARRKQERRGGIETWMNPTSFFSSQSEAGTPWWH